MKYTVILSILAAFTAHADPGVELIESSFDPNYVILESKEDKKTRKCVQTEMKIQTMDPLNLEQTRVIEFVDYQPRNGAQQNIIMMPPTGGVSLVDRQTASRLCKEGARVLLHYHFSGDTEASLEPDIHEKSFVRAITAIRHMSLFFEGDYGIIGTSLGSLYSSQALITETRITKALLVVGGAPILDILVDSQQEGLVELRKQRSEKHNLRTRQDYINFIAPHFRMDLLSRLRPSQNVKVWKVRSLKDDVVPTVTQTELIGLIEPTKVTDSKKGHVRTIVDLLFKKKDIVNFFMN